MDGRCARGAADILGLTGDHQRLLWSYERIVGRYEARLL
jgi:hypothetical protein